MNQLKSLSEIFNHKLFRIPDYQRGYAWLIKPNLVDFWEDIVSLDEGRKHYTGVLTLEPIQSNIYENWVDDKWLIEKNYKPYYIVDGQQRITTAIILIQAIIEIVEEDGANDLEKIQINYTTPADIRKEFIFQLKGSQSILRSYIFGYELNNPSNEFLRTRIFNENSSNYQGFETLYTLNLENAKQFFRDNLLLFPKNIRKNELERIYRKLTINLLFNEYVIDEEMDVYVAFETMNNRGKKLSTLELLKNRLIYLSTLYQVSNDEKTALRNRINNCWKEIYFELGKNKEKPLNDDDFLRAHRIMYFPYRKAQSYDYAAFLLNEKFISKNVLDKVNTTISTKEVIEQREDFVEDEDDQQEAETGLIEVSKLPLKEIDDYISNLQTSARSWFDSFHPEHSPNLTKEEQEWLNRLNNVGINYFRPLVLSALITKKTKPEERVCLFKSIERFIFISFRLTQLRSNFGSSDAYYYSRELLKEKTTISQIVDFFEQRINYNFKDGNFNTIPLKNIIDGKFKHGSGFYSWGALRYVLFEYETYLSQRSKTATQKIQWTNFVNSNDTVTIEHIYPQTPTLPCWKIDFNKYSEKQRLILTNSIGNLLALSQPKNSSLQNKCFSDKLVNSDKTIGYFNGSYSENLVAEKYSEWTPVTIRDRGLEILSFIEKRWDISLGEVDEKLELLHVDFVK